MKISYAWLSRYIRPIPEPEQTAQLLTDCGLEVEGWAPFESVKGGLKGVVTGLVLDCIQHPNADRLKLTKVDVGLAEPLDIVCGAPNVAAGQKVLVATVGTTLYPTGHEPLLIKESKIRGERSQGMICAEDELGIGESHAGILVLPEATPVGVPAAEVLGMTTDTVFEIGLTPNHIDAASHFGTARDLAAVLYNRPEVELLREEVVIPAIAEKHDTPVVVEEPQALKRYSSLRISGVKVGESPDWMKNLLLSIGLRPINAVVDVTNFVLHETGQPLHAFDHGKIRGGKIVVRSCESGTPFTTLDGQTLALEPSDLMICDAEGPLCMAGIYGGLNSGVSAETTEIFLESATFDAVWVRRTSKRHNLKTDSSFRFERGTDPEATLYALYRAASLITKLCGGTIAGGHTDEVFGSLERRSCHYNWAFMDRLIGEPVPREDAKKILSKLGFVLREESSEGLEVEIPGFKVDVEGPADITEEILRIYGYNRIAIPTQVRNSISPAAKPDVHALRNRLSAHLCSQGFFEVLNNSLSASAISAIAGNGAEPVVLANPLSSELDVMRTSMLPALLENIAWNRNRQQSDLRFFEWGKTYAQGEEGGFVETEKIALAVYGNTQPENIHVAPQSVGFFHLKGWVSHVLQLLGLEEERLDWKAVSHQAFKEAYAWELNGKTLVVLGEVHGSLRKHYDIPNAVFAAELNWLPLWNAYRKAKVSYTEVSRFPTVRRDLALLLSKEVSYAEVARLARQTERKLLKEVNLFDVYEGDKLPAGKKSYAVSFVFGDDEQTLTDKQIEKTMERLLKAFTEQLGAELRN